MSQCSSLKKRFLKLWKKTPHLDRERIEEDLKWAKRRNDSEAIYELALKHPLRPLEVKLRGSQIALGVQGFLLIPLTEGLMLVPEGLSRRRAKQMRDELLGQKKRLQAAEQARRWKKWRDRERRNTDSTNGFVWYADEEF